jgi:hypothetical protein
MNTHSVVINAPPGYRRYFCYHIVAGPGPTAGAGVAVITTVAVHNQAERSTYCATFDAVEVGGDRRPSSPTGGSGGPAGPSASAGRVLEIAPPH